VPDEPGRAPSYEELAQLVVSQAEIINLQAEQIETLKGQLGDIEQLKSRIAELERRLDQNSGNSGLSLLATRQLNASARQTSGPSALPAARSAAVASNAARRQDFEMSANPDEIVDHRPERCGNCGKAFGHSDEGRYSARQVVELPR